MLNRRVISLAAVAALGVACVSADALARASMGKALSALATITSIGVVAMIESDFWPIDKVGGAEAARSLIDGLILGSNVWHYNPSLAPAYTNSTLIMLSSSADLNSVLSAGRQED